MKIVNQYPDAPDKPPVLFVTVITAISFVIVFLTWFFAQVLLEQMTNKVSASVDTGMGNATRIAYIQTQTDYLNSHEKLNNGSYKKHKYNRRI